MLIAFRVDASAEIGSGHLMRCLTLANAFSSLGNVCTFICRHLPRDAQVLIVACGHRVLMLSGATHGSHKNRSDAPAHAAWLHGDWEEDASQTAEILSREAADLLVVDHYALDSQWERLAGAKTPFLMVIDDIADRAHCCDLLLDCNAYENSTSRYTSLLEVDAVQLLGPEFVLLRDEFMAQRSLALPLGMRDRLFIGFGGVDKENQTSMALSACRGLLRTGVSVDVVVGSAFPFIESLRQEIASSRDFAGVELHVATPQMAELMARARLAVAGGGTSTWERMCMGVPSIVVATAENQKEALAYLGAMYVLRFLGSAESVDAEALSNAVTQLWDDAATSEKMGAAGARLVDGRGALRVASATMKMVGERSAYVRFR